METQDLTIDDCWNRIGIWSRGAEKFPSLADVSHCRNCPVFAETGRRLLRTPPHEGYRREWTRILADEKETKPLNLTSVFVFRTGSEWLGLPAAMIREIVPMGPIHSLPNISSDSLRGLVNIHGRLHICVSIGSVLGIAKRTRNGGERDPAYSAPARLVVAVQENRPVAFPVTETRGIVHFTPEMVKELPVTVSGTKAAYTTGILQLGNLDIGLLKDKPLFKALTKDLK